MMTSSNGRIFRVTGHLYGEFSGPRWIPGTKASDAELWCLLDLRPNKRLIKQWRGWCFETPSCPLWCHCNDMREPIIWCDVLHLSFELMSPSDAYILRWAGLSLVQVTACRLLGTKPSPEPVTTYCQWDHQNQISRRFLSEYNHKHRRKRIQKYCVEKISFCLGLNVLILSKQTMTRRLNLAQTAILGYPNVVPTSVLPSRRWANISTTFIAATWVCSIVPLITESCHDTNFVAAAGTGGYHDDNPRCHPLQWHHNKRDGV